VWTLIVGGAIAALGGVWALVGSRRASEPAGVEVHAEREPSALV
jgi:hypothetical protein